MCHATIIIVRWSIFHRQELKWMRIRKSGGGWYETKICDKGFSDFWCSFDLKWAAVWSNENACSLNNIGFYRVCYVKTNWKQSVNTFRICLQFDSKEIHTRAGRKSTQMQTFIFFFFNFIFLSVSSSSSSSSMWCLPRLFCVNVWPLLNGALDQNTQRAIPNKNPNHSKTHEPWKII